MSLTRLTATYVCILFVLMLRPTSSEAAEQRCSELGSNCVCSNTFDSAPQGGDNSPGWILVLDGDSQNWRESSNPAGRCGRLIGGHKTSVFFYSTPGHPDPSSGLVTPPISEPEVGMPTGNTVAYVLQGNDHGEGGIQHIEDWAAQSGRA